MSLPVGATYVYKALGLPVPAAGEEEESPYPPELFAPELDLARITLKGLYPCVFGPDGQPNVTGDDLTLYDAGLGYFAAQLLVMGSPAAPGVGGPQMITRKFADSQYTFKVVDAADRAPGWLDLALSYLDGIECVAGPTSDLSTRAGLLQSATPPSGILIRRPLNPADRVFPRGPWG